ncbi:MAG: orotidine 5'-phosphate decarboxylase [Candidatus Thermoplasmatota archaeon]|nr:orotidine 5'-phosphate decarboxylase [Candidatus Thermoplasmatota archaeon]
MAVLQLALDLENLSRAIQIAKESIACTDWIEVGTPLIKSEGMNAIRELRKKFPDFTLVADMKTLDTGRFEVEMASKSGANIICILGVADDDTIKEAIRAAKNYGTKIMVDLMNVAEPVERAKAVESFGADYICLHTSIDEQMRGKIKFNNLKEVCKAVKIPVAIAGGINSENVVEALNFGASIIIVGGAITKTAKPELAAKRIKEAMLKMKSIKSEVKKYGEEDLVKVFLQVSTPNISDAMHRKGAMKGILPIKKGLKLAGRAFTVKTLDGDWAKPVEAIEKAQAGEVLVIDAGGGTTAVWGELATQSCKKKGIAGVVIDGAARDIDDILEMDFSLFIRNIAANAGEPKGYGEIGCEITCGGVVVRPSDWVIGDDSGVVVVPKEQSVEIANRALDVKEKENRIREEIKRGKVLSVVMELEKWEKL